MYDIIIDDRFYLISIGLLESYTSEVYMNNNIPFFEKGWMFVHKVKDNSGLAPDRIERDERVDRVMHDLMEGKLVAPVDISSFSCRLRGRVYNREGFNHGDMVETSIVKTIDTEPYGDGFIVTTKSGSKYRILHDWFYTQVIL